LNYRLFFSGGDHKGSQKARQAVANRPAARTALSRLKGRQKDQRAKKSLFERAACEFPCIHFSAPDSFAFPSLNPEKNYSHGWRGNPTDEENWTWVLGAHGNLSVGLPRHPWDLLSAPIQKKSHAVGG
jgi:hypothetical protein